LRHEHDGLSPDRGRCRIVRGRRRLVAVGIIVLAVAAAWLPAPAALAEGGPPILYNASRHGGPKTGGTEVHLYGLDIDTATSIRFGTTPATSWYTSFGSITLITPAHDVGDVPIVVETPNGTTSSTMVGTNTYTYTEPGVPIVANLSVNNGPEVGGTIVDIYGYDFDGATGVRFGTTPASIFSVAPTQIRATAPEHAVGQIYITVDKPVGSSPPVVDARYTYTEQPPPSMGYLQPNKASASGGTLIGIVGVGFTYATRVQFGLNNDATSFSIYDDNHIMAVAPPAPSPTTQVVNVFVTTPKGTNTATSASTLYYVSPPTITSLSPSRGSTAGGDEVTITGTRLGLVTVVQFDGVDATSFVVESATKIIATAPPHAAGTAAVTVTSLNGSNAPTLSSTFTYDAPGAPVINAVSPNSGPTSGGGTVTLTGSGFVNASAVNVGSTAAAFTVDSATQITVTIPPRSGPGLVNVQVRRGFAVSTAGPSSWYRYV